MNKDTIKTPGMYEISHAVLETITSLPLPVRHLTLRPMNYQKPRHTSWWLVPSPQLPVYQYSKLFFHNLPDYSGMLVGFSFDRGVGRQLVNLVDDSLLMQSNWYWRRFLNDILAGNLINPIKSIQRQSDAAMLFVIEQYSFETLQRRTLASKVHDDRVIFQIGDDATSLQLIGEETSLFKEINYAYTCRDLAMQIEMNPVFSWNWLRFTFGVVLNPVPKVNAEGNTELIWQKFLLPWLPLVG